MIRFCGPGATGELATKYASRASVSTAPPRRSVPSLKDGEVVAAVGKEAVHGDRYDAAGSTVTPLILIVVGSTLLQAAAAVLQE